MAKFSLAIALMLGGVFLIGGCASKSTSALPTLKKYPQAWQVELKNELTVVRACCPKTNEFVKDHVKLRDQIRAGHSYQKADPRGSPFRGLFK